MPSSRRSRLFFTAQDRVPRPPRARRQGFTLGGARTRALILLMASVVANAGCHPRNVRAPYQDAPPNPTMLLRSDQPPIEAIQVPKAKVRQRAGSATLMFSAQRPDRFVGTVQIAGNELVSVALRPDRYELRQPAGRPSLRGFYDGPPSPCAIAALLGLPMEPKVLVSMLLGDAPVIVSPAQSIEGHAQRWERAYPGHEVLVLEEDDLRQELRFRWISKAWHFAGTSVYRRDNDRWAPVFSIAHRDFESFGERHLATRMDITSNDHTGESQTVKIHLLDVNVNPASLRRESSLNASTDPSAPPVDRWDDDWGDEDVAANDGSDADTAVEDTDAHRSSDAVDERPSVPAMFFLSPAGLRARGDLCGDTAVAP